MIGDADIIEAAFAGGGEHFLHRVAPVGERRVDVKRASKIGDFDQTLVDVCVSRSSPFRAAPDPPMPDPRCRKSSFSVRARPSFPAREKRLDKFWLAGRDEKRRTELVRLREVKPDIDLVFSQMPSPCFRRHVRCARRNSPARARPGSCARVAMTMFTLRMTSSRRRTLPETSASSISSIAARCSRICSPTSTPMGQQKVRFAAARFFDAALGSYCSVFVPKPLSAA